MGFFETLRSIVFGAKNGCVISEEEADKLRETLAITRFSIDCAIGLIAKTVSLAQFNFKQNGEPVFAQDWYRWNVEPNPNQNKQQFFYELVREMLTKGEALAINCKRGMFVADSFSRDEYGFSQDVFYDISKSGDTLKGCFKSGRVLYFTYQDKRTKAYLLEAATQYATLLESAAVKYRKNNTAKGILKLATGVGGADKDSQQKEDEKLGKRIAEFLGSEKSSALTLRKGFEYEELGKYHQQQSAEDIPLLTKEIFNRTAEAFHIPSALLLCTGESTATKDNIDQFLNFAVRPILEQMQTEISRKELSLENLQQGIQFEVDDSACKRIDPFSVSEAIDKLIASGGYCIDELRVRLGDAPLHTEWSRRHYITRNYQPIEAAGKEGQQNG